MEDLKKKFLDYKDFEKIKSLDISIIHIVFVILNYL